MKNIIHVVVGRDTEQNAKQLMHLLAYGVP
jgi:hypothetical protein